MRRDALSVLWPVRSGLVDAEQDLGRLDEHGHWLAFSEASLSAEARVIAETICWPEARR